MSRFSNKFQQSNWLRQDSSNPGPILNSNELEMYIRKRAGHSLPSWDMKLLHKVIGELSNDEQRRFFSKTIPAIRELAANSDDVLTIWQNFQNSTVVKLSRCQVAMILANAFFCTVPFEHNDDCINFNSLYSSYARSQPNKIEKLKCLLHYFDFIVSAPANMLSEMVEYRKHAVEMIPRRVYQNEFLKELQVVPTKSLTEAMDLPQVNFANKKVCGGVLTNGCLQEEIKCITCPELLLAKLFPGQMKDNEAILVSGALQYADYTGYGTDSFRCEKGLLKPRKNAPLIAIDAYDFSKTPFDEQLEENYVHRELLKAYSGFSAVQLLEQKFDSIATGNWGGGCFKGNAILKMKIQWLAASIAEKNLHYFPYNNSSLEQGVKEEEAKWRGKTIYELFVDLLPNLSLSLPAPEKTDPPIELNSEFEDKDNHGHKKQ